MLLLLPRSSRASVLTYCSSVTLRTRPCGVVVAPTPHRRFLQLLPLFPNMAPLSTDNSAKPRLNLLMIHGFTQSGHLFSQKVGALKKALVKAFPAHNVTFSFPTGPHRLQPADVPFSLQTADGGDADRADAELDCWAWFQRSGKQEPYTYVGFEEGLASLAKVMEAEGPFDGVIGFSQGGFMAGTMASLLETDRPEAFAKAEANGGMKYPESLLAVRKAGQQPPFKFAVSYAGFAATPNPLYQALYEPKIATPMLHVLGSVDTLVSEERSLRLVDSCEVGKGEGGKRVVYHPGGHFVPASQKVYQGALIDFITEIIGKNGGKESGVVAKADQKEERAEDMDMPF